MEESKECSRCGETKPHSEFAKHKRGKNGLHSWCRLCWNAYSAERYREKMKDPEARQAYRDKQAAWARAARKANPAQHNGYSRKYKHRIDQAQYEALLAAQGGLCLVEGCGRPGIDVDHDHACCPGKRACGQCFRGILCHPCNLALGNVKDSVERLRGLIAYLEKDVLSV